jgi:hypothetical protein
MYKNSVAILGKGPSVKRCTKDFIDGFTVVVACGRPVFEGYESVVGNRAHYDYANRTSTSYTPKQVSRLGIREIVDTGSNTEIRKNFKYKDLDPSTGILAFHDFVTRSEYTTIALIGFDLFQTNKKMYYYKNNEFDKAVDWLWEDGTYDDEGRLTIESGHNTKLTHDYLVDMFSLYPEKKFYMFTSYPFEKRNNLVLK